MRSALALLSCGLLFAQSITRSRVATGFSSIRGPMMKTDLTYLASDELEGRLSLQPGAETAAKWVAAQFQKAGLKPLAPAFLQPVPLIEYRADRHTSGLTIYRAGKPETLSYPDVSGSFPRNVTIKAPIVFAGFGISAPELHYDDYAAIDARGKIVLIFDHEPQENDPLSVFNGKGNTRYAGSHVKTLTAQKHGALGVLVVAEPNRKHPSNQQRLARVRSAGERQRVPTQALADSDIKIPLLTVSEKIAGELLDGQASQLQAAIDATLKSQSRLIAGTSAEIRVVNTEARRGTSWNVVGLVEGSDPQLKAETIVFTAHYDHDGPAANGIFHGADDDGSGTVGVIALARAFAQNEVKPRRSLLFAVFAAEERGLLGSYYYVAHPLRPLNTTRAVINFDMIGRNETPSEQTKGLIEIAPDTSNELNLVGLNYSPDYKTEVERSNNMVGLKLNYKWDEEPALNVYFRSDHYPFALHGIPAVWWFTGFHPDYHQTTDTVEKINFEKMEKIVKLAFLTGFAFADTPAPPQFKP